jgi:DNA-binding NtrC family response regulator
MERAVLLSDAEPLGPDDLGLAQAPASPGHVTTDPSGEVQVDFPETGLSLESVERALLVAALARAGGNQSAAARLLGVSRDTLRYRMDKFGLDQ